MPYNTNAIPPRKEPTGQTQLPCKLNALLAYFFSFGKTNTPLPVSRVKKIISQDPDVQMCSNNAAFVITLAAVGRLFLETLPSLPICLVSPANTGIFTQEMFIQHLTEEAHAQAKLERKPRRNIQYKDVGTLTRRLIPVASSSPFSLPFSLPLE